MGTPLLTTCVLQEVSQLEVYTKNRWAGTDHTGRALLTASIKVTFVFNRIIRKEYGGWQFNQCKAKQNPTPKLASGYNLASSLHKGPAIRCLREEKPIISIPKIQFNRFLCILVDLPLWTMLNGKKLWGNNSAIHFLTYHRMLQFGPSNTCHNSKNHIASCIYLIWVGILLLLFCLF